MNLLSATKLFEIQNIMARIFGDNLHKKRQLSLSYAAIGILESESLFLHKMGYGMAMAREVNKKHAIKQIDRLLSNKGFDIWELSAYWVPYVIGNQKEIVVALDWTSFAGDEQWQLSLNILTSKGSSTPLLWKTIDKSRLKYNRARYEDQLLSRFKEVLPEGVEITLVADRGFAAQKFLEFLEAELKFKYIIRIKSNTIITDTKATSKKAQEWLEKTKITNIKSATITNDKYPIARFICIQDKGMKAAWYLASNLTEPPTRTIINLYAKRWKIEPYFRDIKDNRFGYGLHQTHIKSSERRDRLFLLVALCYRLLIILGQAGENLGFDRMLKANTVKTRTHSLFTQGKGYYDFFQNMSDEKRKHLLEEFGRLLQQNNFWLTIFEPAK
jgi:hypothetical protein